QWRPVVADAVPGAGHRIAGDRRQPHRRLHSGGLRVVSATAATTVATKAALEITDLEVAYMVRGIPRAVLRGVSFQVAPGEAYGLVGESGCGKSTPAFAALRSLPANGRITAGHIKVAGDDVTTMNDAQLRSFRARHASMVYQDPGAALNPSLRIGPQ